MVLCKHSPPHPRQNQVCAFFYVLRDLGTTLSHLQVLWMSRCCLQDLDGISTLSSLKVDLIDNILLLLFVCKFTFLLFFKSYKVYVDQKKTLKFIFIHNFKISV